MSLVFYNAKPSSFTIYSYNYNELVSTKEYDEIDFMTSIEDDFVGISKIRIVFNKTNPYQRIHLSNISFGDITDYVLDYSDMTSSPTASVAEKIKKVNVITVNNRTNFIRRREKEQKGLWKEKTAVAIAQESKTMIESKAIAFLPMLSDEC